MIIGTVKETKTGENRVGLTPAGAGVLTRERHEVLVETTAGKNSGFSDEEYSEQGAQIIQSAAEVWKKAEMIIKVKEPLEKEFEHLRKGLILFTYLHLAAAEKVTKALLEKEVTGIAYETIELEDGSLPLLTPMSEVAGRMAVQVGMHYLERTYGGSGKLLAGVPGVMPATVVIIGSGVVGINAAKMAHGVGARTIIIGRNLNELRKIDDIFNGEVTTLASNPHNIGIAVEQSDVVIGSVAITGAAAPKLVTRAMIRKMKPGSVAVDVSIDQGGSFETSRPTSHADPIYVEENVVHYCVTNMPGAVPNTSTHSLTNATLPYAIKIAKKGIVEAAKQDGALAKGINTFNGKLTNQAVAEALRMQHEPLHL
ncbi:alanine dehydrogenase [Candidatus Woesearchaeota archaeon]|nr:alanine dehydrogenase [Candidatus Woesearchaeota archaeon]